MTMVELMVALAIISVGVFALTAGATLVTRLDGSAAIQSRAAVIGATRLERLRSMSCTSVAAGGDTTRGVISTWTTRAITNGTSQRGVTINLTVQFPTATGLHTQTYRTILPC
jgi:Tfp pilus assembly protein PilV